MDHYSASFDAKNAERNVNSRGLVHEALTLLELEDGHSWDISDKDLVSFCPYPENLK